MLQRPRRPWCGAICSNVRTSQRYSLAKVASTEIVDRIKMQLHNVTMMTPEQSRAARGLLDWSQQELADAAGLGLSTVRDFEKGRREPLPASLEAMQAALKTEGVIFLAEGEMAAGGPGVRLGKPKKAKR